MTRINGLRCLLIAAILIGWSVLVHARPVFGPQKFVRDTGSPDELDEVFQLRGSASAYKLIIENGNPDGSNRVSSAWVWLNGIQILTPDDFNHQVAEIRTPVVLLSSNELRVRIAGKPGGILIVSVSAVIGPAGGFVKSQGGAELTIPPGAIDHEITVSLDDTTLFDTGVTLPTDYIFLEGVIVDLGGAELSAEADLAIPSVASLTDRLIVSRVLELGSLKRLSLVDTASIEADGFVHTNSPPFPGIRLGGSYMFLQMPSHIGILGVDVQSLSGSPVKNAIVSVSTSAAEPDASVSSLTHALGSQAVFVGQTDSNGFAAVPGVAPRTTINTIATAPGASASAPLFGITSTVIPPIPPAFPGLIDRIKDILVDHVTQGPPPPDQIPRCSCPVLTLIPNQVPESGSSFVTGDTRQLAVFCKTDNVTSSTEIFSLGELGDLLLNGSQIHFTIYVSLDSTVAVVSEKGLIKAVSPGTTSVVVFTETLQFFQVNGVLVPFLCFGTGEVTPVTVKMAGPPPRLGQGQAFASPDTSICDFPSANPPCIFQEQFVTPSPFSLAAEIGGATSNVSYDGFTLLLSASTTTAGANNRADADGQSISSYVLTSTTLPLGTPVSLTALINRTGALSVQVLQSGDTVTAQEFFDINLSSNNVDAFVEINQGERAFGTTPPSTLSSLTDSNVFVFSLAGNSPVLVSQPTIINSSANQSSAFAGLGQLIVKFEIPVGQPFSFGLFDHVNTHGGDTGVASSTCVIPQLQFVLPLGVSLQPQ